MNLEMPKSPPLPTNPKPLLTLTTLPSPRRATPRAPRAREGKKHTKKINEKKKLNTLLCSQDPVQLQ